MSSSTAKIAFYAKNNPRVTDPSRPYCIVQVQGNDLVDFTKADWCENDEARAVELIDVPAGFVIRLSDDSKGKTNDDWVEIIVKNDIFTRTIDTLERSFESNDLRVIYHRDNNLNDKVSQMAVTTYPIGPIVDLYEGNGATQDLVCSVQLGGFLVPRAQTFYNFKSKRGDCANDEARSAVLYDFPANVTFRLFDHPDGKTSDDWVQVTTRRKISRKVIASFEKLSTDADLLVQNHRHNGLDGKVSRFEYRP